MWHANYTLEYFSAAIRCTSPATVSPEENKHKSLHRHYMVTSAYAKCSAQCGAGRLPFTSCLCFQYVCFHFTGPVGPLKSSTLFLRPNFAGSNRMQVQVMSAAAELREQGNKLFEESHGEPWRAMESHGEPWRAMERD